MLIGRQSVVFALSLCVVLTAPLSRAFSQGNPVRGQVLYAPAYSEIHYGDRYRSFNLTTTLSVRNTDRSRPLILRRVDYFSAAGVLVRSYLTAPQVLAPLASAVFVVKESDKAGGVNPAFLVEWTGEQPLVTPIVETVMVGTSSGQGISFVLPARVLEEKP